MTFDPSNPYDWWAALGHIRLACWLYGIAKSIYNRDVIRKNTEAIKDCFTYGLICGSGIYWSTIIFPVIPQLISDTYNGKLGDLTGLPLPLQILGMCFIFGAALFFSGMGVWMTYFSSKSIVCTIQKIAKTNKQPKS